jgi:hypothetical protein
LTTLAEARAQLYALHERRAQLKLRIERSELISERAAQDAAIKTGHMIRDRILNAPVRYAQVLAGDFEVDAAMLYRALAELVRAECYRLAALGQRADAAGETAPAATVMR